MKSKGYRVFVQKTAVSFYVVSLIITSLAACNKQVPQGSSGSSNQSSAGAPSGPQPGSPPPAPVPAGAQFSVAAISPMVANLATVREVNVSLTAAATFKGDVDIFIEREELDVVDKAGDVVITATPSRISLNNGETKSFVLRVETKSSAPSFNDHFHVVARQVGATTPVEAATVVNYRVNPLIEVAFHGGPSPERMVPAFTDANIRPHAGGVTVRFLNYDAALTHVVHGQGAIPHQNINMPMAVGTGTAPGGNYEVRVTATTPNLAGQFYCHNHESGALAKRFVFNFQ